MKLFSQRNRPVHLGPYPLEKLGRTNVTPDLSAIAPQKKFQMVLADDPHSITNAMDDYIALLDSVRDGPVKEPKADIPNSPEERIKHLKAAGYFLDCSMIGCCSLSSDMLLDKSFCHPRIGEWLALGQTDKVHLRLNLAAVYQRMKDTAKLIKKPLEGHSHALVYLVEYPRDPGKDEAGTQWIKGLQAHRANMRAAETASVAAFYLRNLGFSARAHSVTSTDVNFSKLAVAAGLASITESGSIDNPYIGNRFGLAVVTTNLELVTDLPLAEQSLSDKFRSKGPAWWLGYHSQKSFFTRLAYRKRQFKDSLFPMENVKRVEETTSFIDPEHIPRVPKRTEFFVRIALGDLGDAPREASVDGFSVMKNPFARSLSATLNCYAILQRAKESETRIEGYDDSPETNSDIIKATLNFLGADLVGISEAPSWVWYSHSADGKKLEPAHKYAITTLVDQGFDTMDGGSGDDWISTAQSMRSYMRASLLGGVVAQHLRNLGYAATNHTAADGDVLQPPLMLLSGLGEISRIGDVILNPYLGPRLKCGVVTTDFPMMPDKPIDFGLQTFCGNCKKCARECPSGAITAGEKRMFNGYEIWKPDSEKCARYRMTNDAGAMCGRCMKTCPWNLEGIFREAPIRWLAVHFPILAPLITRLDDLLGNGSINSAKRWWWDLRTNREGQTLIATDANRRELNVGLDLKHEDQTLACYPADLAPPPYPSPSPIDREAGIVAYQEMPTPAEYKKKLASGDTENIAPKYVVPDGPPPVFPARLQKRTIVSADGKVVKFDFVSMEDTPLPTFEAGAHIDVIAEPQFVRQYSLCGDPSDETKYSIGILREDEGRRGSLRIHQRLHEGRPVLISRPRNHFPIIESEGRQLLVAGGIGVTPMIAMAHALHKAGKDFTLYYKASSRAGAGFVEELEGQDWADKIEFYFSDENRLNVADILGAYTPGDHLYTCGPAGFMDAVFESASAQGWHEENLHREYFSAPTTESYENTPFKLILQQSGVEIDVPADMKATEALAAAGYAIDTKCSDGICGVCATRYTKGDIEHRDYVLSKAQRLEKVILCCSRAAEEGGEVVLDM